MWAAGGSGPATPGTTGDGGGGKEGPAGDGDGDDGNSGNEMPSVAPVQFTCDPELSGQSPPLRRLTKVQYRTTLSDLLSMALDSKEMAEGVMDELGADLDKLIEDVRIEDAANHPSFRRLDQAVQQNHVDNWFAIGRHVGEIVSNADHLPSLLGSCAESSGSEADDCIDSFIARFGRLVLRRPLSDDEVGFYRGFYAPSTGIDPAGVVDVVTGLLNAPSFLYLVEHGADALDKPQDTYQLEAYELASRLSYHLWNTMPDTELLELAESGELLDQEVYEGQVERLWSDRRTHATLSQFFLEWMKLEELPELDRNNHAVVFQNFAGENLPSKELRQAMIDEAVDMLDYYTWDAPGGLQQIFLSPYSFAKSQELADIYGIEPWDGSSTPPQIPGDRPGLLTRAAFLSTGTANTRPIMKGVFIRTQMLCDHIDPPPANAMAIPPDISPDLTTREVVEQLTEVGGCSGCHTRLINPLGFPTEGFDSLGRTREEQQLFDAEGAPTISKPVNTESAPQIVPGDTSVVSGPGELMEVLSSSGKLEACFARHYFRFSFGRLEGVESDGCALEQMRKGLEEGGSLADMLRTIALSDTFRTRTFVPEEEK